MKRICTPIVGLIILSGISLFCVAAKERGAGKTVTIQNMKFSPGDVTISAGESVTWVNKDDRDHSVVAGDGSFSSGTLSSGASFTQTFKKRGTYRYACGFHPRMKGSVVVGD